jgi:hypothetical protein
LVNWTVASWVVQRAAAMAAMMADSRADHWAEDLAAMTVLNLVALKAVQSAVK